MGIIKINGSIESDGTGTGTDLSEIQADITSIKEKNVTQDNQIQALDDVLAVEIPKLDGQIQAHDDILAVELPALSQKDSELQGEIDKLNTAIRLYVKALNIDGITDSGSLAYQLGRLVIIRLWFKITQEFSAFSYFHTIWKNNVTETTINDGIRQNFNGIYFSDDSNFRVNENGDIINNVALTSGKTFNTTIIAITKPE